MKKISKLWRGLTVLLMLSTCVITQADQTSAETEYDESLATELGADQYGMRSYVMVVLLTGPNDATVTDKQEREALFAGHFSNMDRLAKAGKLVLAGPFIEGEPKRGLFVYAVDTLEEAEELVKTDPAVKAGIFVYEMTRLYSSAALMQISGIHERIAKPSTEP